MKLVSVEGAAVSLGVSIRTVYQQIRDKKLTTVMRDGKKLIQLDVADVGEVTERLSQVASAAAVQKAMDSEVIARLINEQKFARRISVGASVMACAATAACSLAVHTIYKGTRIEVAQSVSAVIAAQKEIGSLGRTIAQTETRLEFAVAAKESAESAKKKAETEGLQHRDEAQLLRGKLTQAEQDAKMERESLLAQVSAEKTRADYFAGGGLGPAQLARK